jgi:hypothetical protein
MIARGGRDGEDDMTFEIFAIIVFVNVLATIALWRSAARAPAKPKKGFIDKLRKSEPITPKHQPPAAIDEKFGSFVTDEDRQFFADFADFASVVNWWFGDAHVGSAWRLQELPDTELKLDITDRPSLGRRYDVFHNQVRLGSLELSAGIHYSAEKPDVFANIELDWVRLLAFESVEEFLTGLALHVSDPNPNTKEHFEARLLIDRALTQTLWQAQQVTEFEFDGQDWGELKLRLNGSAPWYLTRRQALRNRLSAA